METLKLLVVQAPCIGCTKVDLEVHDLQACCASMLYMDASEHPYFKSLWGKRLPSFIPRSSSQGLSEHFNGASGRTGSGDSHCDGSAGLQYLC